MAATPPQVPTAPPAQASPAGSPPSSGANQSVPRVISSEWIAPLPPPTVLEGYESLVPGAADRIIQMAEREQAHRHACELESLPKAHRTNTRGQYLGWALAVVAVVAAAIVAIEKGPWEVSVALVGIPVLGAVQALITGHRQKQKKESPDDDDEDDN
jgi:uncharacterized membrane protein